MSDLFTIAVSVGSTTAVIAGLFTGWTKASNAKDAKLEASKTETIQVLTSNRDAWKTQAEDINLKYEKYRDHTHKQINEANSALLKCTEECSLLKIKTDMTPVLIALEKIDNNQLVIVKLLDVISLRVAPPIQSIPFDPSTSKST